HGVDHAEHDGIGADAEHQGDDNDRRHARGSAHAPQAVAHILPKPFGSAPPPRVADSFLDTEQVAELAPRGPLRVFRRQAGADALPRLGGEVVCKLLLEILITPSPSEGPPTHTVLLLMQVASRERWS